LEAFLEIITKPDNIPIAGMLLLVLFFMYISLKMALRNDKLIAKGKRQEIEDIMDE
jgi:hypothetical protein